MVAATCGAAGHNIVCFVVLHDQIPEVFNVRFLVIISNPWGSSEGPHCSRSITADNVLVVAMVLRKRLLEQGCPESCLIVSAEFRELSFEVSFAIWDERKVVIDDDRVGNTQGPEVEGVDSVLV